MEVRSALPLPGAGVCKADTRKADARKAHNRAEILASAWSAHSFRFGQGTSQYPSVL